MDADPTWLPPDPDGERQLDEPYVYRSAPIPFRDFPIGTNWCLGWGGTSSNRKDNQRSIQIFLEDGEYNDQGDDLQYSDQALGDAEGYAAEVGGVLYEPPKNHYRDYDKRPGSSFARLLMGGKSGLAWPDFNALGAHAHRSFGTGPIYRGRPDQAGCSSWLTSSPMMTCSTGAP